MQTLNNFAAEQLPALLRYLDAEVAASHDAQLAIAMRYSLDAGGKRIRPLLTLTTAATFGVNPKLAFPAAAAIEFVHTYSLIHDDLPAMDNADLRRGKNTSHVQFDEATAILAGDALLTDAFRIISSGSLSVATRLQLIQTLAVAAGSTGMVAGQMMDMAGSTRALTIAELQSLHRHKTGALLRAAVRMGAIIGHADNSDLRNLDDFAAAFGLGFQIKDDIEDATATQAELGKSAGQDQANTKTTYVSLFGLDGAKQRLQEQYVQARTALDAVSVDTTILKELAEYLSQKG